MTEKQQKKAIQIIDELICYLSEAESAYKTPGHYTLKGQELIEKAQKFVQKADPQ